MKIKAPTSNETMKPAFALNKKAEKMDAGTFTSMEEIFRLTFNRWREIINAMTRQKSMLANNNDARLHGNQIKGLSQININKAFGRPFDPEIEPFDKSKVDSAAEIQEACVELMKVARLDEAMREAYKDCIACTIGWVEVNHPQNPYLMDILRRADKMGHAGKQIEMETGDVWTQTDDSGFISPDALQDIDPTMSVDEDNKLKPMFGSQVGYPFAAKVDPRFVVIPDMNKSDIMDQDWIARIRIMSLAEVKSIFKIDGDLTPGIASDFIELANVENVPQTLIIGHVAVVEVYLRRCRVNPRYNNWVLYYIPYASNNIILINQQNDMGGFVPLVPVRMSEFSTMNSLSFTQEMAPFAIAYSDGIAAIMKRMGDAKNNKYGVGNGLHDTEQVKLDDPSYSGPVKMQPDSVFKIDKNQQDPEFIGWLQFLQNAGQAQLQTNDFDRGIAVKDVTARQASALVEASEVMASGVRECLRQAYTMAVLKIMYLAGVHNSSNELLSSVTGRSIKLDVIKQDIGSSYTFYVRIGDEQARTNEEGLIATQMFKNVMDPALAQLVNRVAFLRFYLKRMGCSPDSLIRKGAEDPAAAPPPSIPGVEPGGLPPGGISGIGDMGEHPERDTGSRGVGPGSTNAVAGLKQQGM